MMIKRVNVYEIVFMIWFIIPLHFSVIVHGQPVNNTFILPNSYTSISSQLNLIEDTFYLNTSRWDIGSNLILRGFSKLSGEGEVYFSKDFGVPMRDLYLGYRTMLYQNGHLFFASSSQDTQSVVRSHLFKCTMVGDTVWTSEYSSTTDFLAAYSLIAHPEGGFVLLGTVKEQVANESDIFILRTDTAGNELWRTYYGAQGISEEPSGIFHLSGEEYFIAGGELTYPPNYPDNPYYFTSFLLKYKNNPNIIERKNLSRPNQGEKYAGSIISTSDANFIYATRINQNIPYTNLSKGLLVKIDSNANEIWSIDYGEFGTFNTFVDLAEKEDETFVIAGRKSYNSPLGREHGWVITIDPNGNILSQTTFVWPGINHPDVLYMALRDITLLPDGRVAGCGDIVTDKQRIWFFVSDQNGCFDQFCTYLGEQVAETTAGFAVYPNPTQDWLYVYNPYTGLPLNAKLLNLNGQTVFSNLLLHGETTNAIAVSELTSGIYFLQITLPNGKVVTEKIIKQ